MISIVNINCGKHMIDTTNEERVRYQQSELKWNLDRWVDRVSHSYPITKINPNAL